ncbi:MAG: ABC-2 transporter permease [Oscillospiraceae bacterium]|nr:ABC-2 transporter permease [Oscillospiraceae bacterium]
MTGLFYKELRLNRTALIISAVIPFLMMLLFVLLDLLPVLLMNGSDAVIAEWKEITGRTGETGTSFNMMQIMPVVCAPMCSGLMQIQMFTVDETKKWGCFTASHPKGICTAVYYKYVIIFLTSVLSMVSCEVAQSLYWLTDHIILGTKADDMAGTGLSLVFMLLVFFQMFCRMIDIPFIVRFGSKKGGAVKAGIIGALFLAFFVYFLFGPLPESVDVIALKLDEFLTKLQSGKLPAGFYAGLAAFLWVTIFGTYFSYKISCKLYMKGVEQYDK